MSVLDAAPSPEAIAAQIQMFMWQTETTVLMTVERWRFPDPLLAAFTAWKQYREQMRAAQEMAVALRDVEQAAERARADRERAKRAAGQGMSRRQKR